MEMSWLQVLVLAFGNLAWMMPVFFWVRSESRADHRFALSIIDAIQKEMKDFHGRLEKQDAEFKGRLEKQDAEFKAFLRQEDQKRTQILIGK